MSVNPIQVMQEGVLIPLEYLHNASEFDVELVSGYVQVSAKQNGDAKEEKECLHLLYMR